MRRPPWSVPIPSPSQDKFGDSVTVVLTKTGNAPANLFTAANVNKVFTFDTGSVNGVNTTAQQLENLNITKLGPAATGIDITITATPAQNASTTGLSVGYIDAAGINLGAISVTGDLGRIAAGGFNFSRDAFVSLTVDSLGALPVSTTQAPGGNLLSLISGAVGSITVGSSSVSGNIGYLGNTNAPSIGIGGGGHGTLGNLTVYGSIYGGSIPFAGSVRTQGNIGSVTITGSLYGGSAASTGIIGTAGSIGNVTVNGSIAGGGGAFSGAILASKNIQSVYVGGDLLGGAGANSGEIGAAGNLGTSANLGPATLTNGITIAGSVEGGSGTLSGVILATGNIYSVTIGHGLVGYNPYGESSSLGASSGQIGAGKSILGTVTIGSDFPVSPDTSSAKPLDGTFQGIEAGSGPNSGMIYAKGSINNVFIDGYIDGYSGGDEASAHVHASAPAPTSASGSISAGGNINSVFVSEAVDGGTILSGGSIGSVTIYGSLTDNSLIQAAQNITGMVSVNEQPEMGSDVAGLHLQHSVVTHSTVLSPGSSYYYAGYGPGILDSSIIAQHGSIGSIIAGATGTIYNEGYRPQAIDFATITAGGNIGSITAQAGKSTSYAMVNTDVTVGGSIGGITATSGNGDSVGLFGGGTGISESQIIAGKSIGPVFAGGYGSNYYGPSDGIEFTIIRAGTGIGNITAKSLDTLNPQAGAIISSGINAGGNIGSISAYGAIDGSVFIAGINLGTAFNTGSVSAGAGSFDNTSAAAFGFGSSKSNVNAQIGAITLTGGEGGAPATFIQDSTFVAGVHGSGVDKTFGTKDDSVPAGSAIGAITAPGGLTDVFVESGSIGATSSGSIIATHYVATDSAVSAGGIGQITVNASIVSGNSDLVNRIVPIQAGGSISGSVPGPSAGVITMGSGAIAPSGTPVVLQSHLSGIRASSEGPTVNTYGGIYNSTFVTNAGIGSGGTAVNVNLSLDGSLYGNNYAGIANTTFEAGHAIGDVTVTISGGATGGNVYGIVNSHFNAGVGGFGGVGDVSSTISAQGPFNSSAAIANVNFDGSVCSCMAGNMGAVYAENADTGSGAVGVLDSVFRVHGNIGSITSVMDASNTTPGIQGSTFSAFGSIGAINVTGSVTADSSPSRFLAGFDIGPGVTPATVNTAFNSVNLTSKSLDLQKGQSIGDVTISGTFQGSDIVASVNPGAGYIFGGAGAQNTNISTGGSIGAISIGTGLNPGDITVNEGASTSHAIEAASIGDLTVCGTSYGTPAVLYVDGGTGDVGVTTVS